MNQPLSPATLAVIDTFTNAVCSETYKPGQGIAAALRAVADQVVPAASPRDRATWSPFAGQIRAEILAIAAELEGQS
jgi:hypothetical protein